MNEKLPGFKRIDDGIMHSAGMSPVECEGCGKLVVECGIYHHENVCQILQMQRAVFSKNNRKKPKK
jgi:hypothetical protein